MGTTRGSVARATAMRTVMMVSGVSAGVLVLGGSAVWLLERGIPRGTFGSWGDSLWWAITSITTTGYGGPAQAQPVDATPRPGGV